MKRINIIILLAAMLLMLSACAVQEAVSTEAPAVEAVTQPATEVVTQPATEAATEMPTQAPTEPPQPEEIAITMENWEEYFELRKTEQVYVSESCNVINRVFGYGVFLKEEFADRFAEGSELLFDLEYNLAWTRVMGDLAGDSYMLTGLQADAERKTLTANLTDFRGLTSLSEESDFYNQVAAEFAFDSEFGA